MWKRESIQGTDFKKQENDETRISPRILLFLVIWANSKGETKL